MANYTKTTDFEVKDALPSGDPGKIIKGTEFEVEFDAISASIATKADQAGPTFTGTATFDDVSVTNGLTVDGTTLVVDDTNNRVGIGTASPGQKLDVSASTGTLSVSSTATGTSSRLFLFNTTDNLYGEIGNDGSDLIFKPQGAERMRVTSTGDVGIGTPTPLSLGGGVRTLDIRSSTTAKGSGLVFGEPTTQHGYLYSLTSGLVLDAFGARSVTLQTNGVPRLTADSSGRVLIAHDTAKAGDKLEVTANGDTSTIGLFGRASDGGSSIRFRANAAATEYARISSTNANNLTLHTGSSATERMRIASDGKVGIGTSSPSGALDVTESATNGVYLRGATAGIVVLDDSGVADSSTPMRWQASDDGSHIFYAANRNASTGKTTGSVEHMRIDSSGNVGIGTANPEADSLTLEKGSIRIRATSPFISFSAAGDAGTPTYIQRTDSGRKMSIVSNGSGTDGYITMSTGGTAERMRIDSSGNVGIGTTAPFGKAEIVGDTTGGSVHDTLVLTGGQSGVVGSGSRLTLSGAHTAPLIRGGYIEAASTDVGNAHYLSFGTSASSSTPTERMRIDSSGNLLVGKTASSGSTAGVEAQGSGYLSIISGTASPLFIRLNSLSGTQSVMNFFRDGTASGGVNTTSGGLPAFYSASDSRLKENITDHESELANVMALRPVRWDWKANDNSGEGFIAQELQETAWADLVSEGDDGMLQVSGLGAVETRLIKAMQEQQVVIEALKAEVEALKNA